MSSSKTFNILNPINFAKWMQSLILNIAIYLTTKLLDDTHTKDPELRAFITAMTAVNLFITTYILVYKFPKKALLAKAVREQMHEDLAKNREANYSIMLPDGRTEHRTSTLERIKPTAAPNLKLKKLKDKYPIESGAKRYRPVGLAVTAALFITNTLAVTCLWKQLKIDKTILVSLNIMMLTAQCIILGLYEHKIMTDEAKLRNLASALLNESSELSQKSKGLSDASRRYDEPNKVRTALFSSSATHLFAQWLLETSGKISNSLNHGSDPARELEEGYTPPSRFSCFNFGKERQSPEPGIKYTSLTQFDNPSFDLTCGTR
ncbi:MAG: hypothetical protein K0U29_06280 [Gammaproteobacteria bacterium]|nr:hypothetical protein [Gammaproteobacteria bacterium]MCH9744522.1 hypothetical protein [Gammaproteobacteria bacterium]